MIIFYHNGTMECITNKLSFHRFGKHRKSIDNPNGLTSKGDGEADRSEGRTEVDRAEVERLAAARRLQQEEHDRMQEQYRRMIENTARSSQVKHSSSNKVVRGSSLVQSYFFHVFDKSCFALFIQLNILLLAFQ